MQDYRIVSYRFTIDDAPEYSALSDKLRARGLSLYVSDRKTATRPQCVNGDIWPCGYYRVVSDGQILYDWAEWRGAKCRVGYYLDFPASVAPCPPMPSAAQELSRTAQAVAWLTADPERTQAQAAAKFGITQSGVSVALTRRGIMLPERKPRAPSRIAQAVEWITAEPGRTQTAASHKFGVTQSNISAALSRHPRALSRAVQAVVWLMADQYRTQAQAAAKFGVAQSNISTALLRELHRTARGVACIADDSERIRAETEVAAALSRIKRAL